MREIDVKLITEKIRDLCIEANTDLGEDVLHAFDRAMAEEESPLGVEILEGTEGECPDRQEKKRLPSARIRDLPSFLSNWGRRFISSGET